MGRIVEINGLSYQLGDLAPWDAFHIMRRISPLLVSIGPQILGLAEEQNDAAKALGTLQLLFSQDGLRFTQILAMMPERDIDYVAMTCLRGVTMRQESAWARVLAEGAERPQPMFPHLRPAILMRLVVEVLKEELAGFFAVSNYSGAGAATPTP